MRYIKHIHCSECRRLVLVKGLTLPRVGMCNRCMHAEMDRILQEETMLMLYARHPRVIQ